MCRLTDARVSRRGLLYVHPPLQFVFQLFTAGYDGLSECSDIRVQRGQFGDESAVIFA
jgi:hypothetical protein